MDLSVGEVVEAVRANNNNSGSGYMEIGSKAKYIRTFGRLTDIDEIKKVVVSHRDGTPIFLRDIADIGLGYAPRYGAMTMDGKGEVVDLLSETSIKEIQGSHILIVDDSTLVYRALSRILKKV